MRLSSNYIHSLIYKHQKEKLKKLYENDFEYSHDNLKNLFGGEILLCRYKNSFYETDLSLVDKNDLGDFVQIFYIEQKSYQVHLKNEDYSIVLTFYKNDSHKVIYLNEIHHLSEKIPYTILDQDIDQIQEALSSDKLFDVNIDSLYKKIFHKEYKDSE